MERHTHVQKKQKLLQHGRRAISHTDTTFHHALVPSQCCHTSWLRDLCKSSGLDFHRWNNEFCWRQVHFSDMIETSLWGIHIIRATPIPESDIGTNTRVNCSTFTRKKCADTFSISIYMTSLLNLDVDCESLLVMLHSLVFSQIGLPKTRAMKWNEKANPRALMFLWLALCAGFCVCSRECVCVGTCGLLRAARCFFINLT